MEDLKETKAVEQPEEKQEPKKEVKENEEKVNKPEKAEKAEKAEEKKEETPAIEIAKLQSDLQVANNKIAELETATKELANKEATIKEYETMLSNMVDTKMKQVPEEFKDLIPDNMDIKQKLSWLTKAEEKGLFTKKEKTKPTVEVGKPMNTEAPQVDTSKLSGSQLLRMAYNTFKN